MDFLSVIGSWFQPITNLVDKVSTTDQERMELHNKLVELQTNFLTNAMDMQTKLAEAQAKIQVAESGSDSWLQKSYRPICALSSMVVMVLVSMGYGHLDDNMYYLFLSIFGVTGGSRGIEKLTSIVKG